MVSLRICFFWGGLPTRTSRTYGSISRFTFTALGKRISAIAEQPYDSVSHINNSCHSVYSTNNRSIHVASRCKYTRSSAIAE